MNLTTLDDAFSNLDLNIQKYEEFARNGVFIWIHPAWQAFSDKWFKPSSQKDSKNLLENYIKDCLINIKNQKTQYRAFSDYANALYNLNEITFFSALKETSPLVFLALPGKFNKKQYGRWQFPKQYCEYLGQMTGSLPNFIAFETESYHKGGVGWNTVNKIDKILERIDVDDVAIIGGNVNQCIKTFLLDFREHVTDIGMLAISDICYIQPKHRFPNKSDLPSGEPLFPYFPLMDFIREKVSGSKKEIKHYDLQGLQQFVYSFPVLNSKLNPEESVWQKVSVPDRIVRADQIIGLKPVDRFLEMVRGNNLGYETQFQEYFQSLQCKPNSHSKS